MKTYQKCLSIILENEGGYCWISGDSGGETYVGIARNYEKLWEGWKIIDKIKKERKVEKLKYNEKVKEITIDIIDPIYRKKYWDKIKGDDICIINPELALHVFDMGVNAGITTAIKLLQRCLGLTDDGIIGKMTLEGVKKANHDKLLKDYINRRKEYYIKIATGEREKFLKGWLNRIDHTINSSTCLV
jgi:lysozyme family protein